MRFRAGAAVLAGVVTLGCNQILGIQQPTDRDGGTGGGASGTTGAGGASAGTSGSAGRGGSVGSGGSMGGTTGVAGAAGTGGGGTMGSGGRGGSGGALGTGGTTGMGGTGGVAVVPCGMRQASDGLGIYVATTGTDDASCGSRAQACKTIQAGINRARTLGRSVVYVNVGTYSEAITMSAGIRVEGAWGAVGQDWSPICTPTASEAVIIQSPGANTTVMADALGGTASLAWLSIRSKPTAAAGESLYGVFARGANTRLDLEEVRVTVAAGGAGSVGTKGADGMPGTGACNPAGDGVKGSDAAMGSGAAAGSFDLNGYVPGDAPTGPTGGTGHNGIAMASTASCYPCYEYCRVRPGSNEQCESRNGLDSCGMNDGSPGCGGPGGRGGQGGRGGGGSVAVFVWGATVNVIRGLLAAGSGGQGSAGGAGGNGGPGAPGVGGTPGPTCLWGTCIFQVTGSSCTTFIGPHQGPPGAGGAGGPGGLGGPGGGGAGGFSFAVYGGGGGSVNVSPATVLTAGMAGVGASNGAAGMAKTIGP